MNKSIVLSVGDTHHLRLGKDRIVYDRYVLGKDIFYHPDEMGVFLSRVCLESLLPQDQNRIRIDGVNLIAESVRPDEIRLRDNDSTDPKPLGYEKWLRRTTDFSVTTNLYPSIIILYLIRIIG